MIVSDIEIRKAVEALLFVSEKPLSLKQITDVLEDAESAKIKILINDLKQKYCGQEHGVELVEVAGGYQFCTNPECSKYVKKLYRTRRVFRLSGPALETLAIIAYRQPITRSEIEFIRGVNVDGVIKTLLDKDLIRIKGKKEVPGRPIMYNTTEQFLQYFGLKSLHELPPLQEFIAQVTEENMDKDPVTEERGAQDG